MTEYIEKAELIKKLCFETAEWHYSPTIKTIMEFPAADVQPVRRGTWVHFNNDSNIIFCSECNNEAYWDTDYGQQLFDYCPYCGARMDLKDGDTECHDTK